MDAFVVALASAVVGAGCGALGTWWTGRLRDHEQEARSDHRSLQAKLHEFDVRIVRLEALVGFYSRLGRQREEDDDVPQQE